MRCRRRQAGAALESCVSDTCLHVPSSIGTEHEKFGFRKSDKRPMDYQEIKHLLEGLVRRCVQPRDSSSPAHGLSGWVLTGSLLGRRFGWVPIMEGEFIIGCQLDGQSVTLEPGGQLELSGTSLVSSVCPCLPLTRLAAASHAQARRCPPCT